MAERRDAPREFEDREGVTWTVRATRDFKWHLEPEQGDDESRHIVTPPPDVDDPSELDDDELQRLLDAGLSTRDISEPTGSSGD